MNAIALHGYRFLVTLISPLLPIYLWLRSLKGKEDKSRLQERFGKASQPRPDGVLLWLHGASVGETVSSLALARAVLKARPDAMILITSGTVTSAEMVEERLHQMGMEAQVIHQYIPLDVPHWVRRFLRHWRPDIAIILETEIWPSLIVETDNAGIPVLLASAQLSARSFRLWSGAGRRLARVIFPKIHTVFAVDPHHASKFSSLENPPQRVQVMGSMKTAAGPLPDIPLLQDALNRCADGRQIILLASSHEGEETLFLEVMERLGGPDQFLGIIAPRHIDRAKAIHAEITARGEAANLRSQQRWPERDHRFWIADQMGEMGGLFRAADVIVLGGAFARLGGHNPMEAAALGKGVISGTHVFKNTAAFRLLKDRGGVIFADTAKDIAAAITDLTSSATRRSSLNKGAVNAYRMVAGKADELAGQILQLVRKGDE
ncbi:3-deoxy-D-manno-octulosonic acid transferase [Alphaproteobacteria bacterium LSUCC0684]